MALLDEIFPDKFSIRGLRGVPTNPAYFFPLMGCGGGSVGNPLTEKSAK